MPFQVWWFLLPNAALLRGFASAEALIIVAYIRLDHASPRKLLLSLTSFRGPFSVRIAGFHIHCANIVHPNN